MGDATDLQLNVVIEVEDFDKTAFYNDRNSSDSQSSIDPQEWHF
jgi:hypothetical protein